MRLNCSAESVHIDPHRYAHDRMSRQYRQKLRDKGIPFWPIPTLKLAIAIMGINGVIDFDRVLFGIPILSPSLPSPGFPDIETNRHDWRTGVSANSSM